MPRNPFAGGAFQPGGIADPEADDSGGSDDSGGGGGGGDDSSSVGSVTRDRGGAGAGGGGEPTVGVGGDDDSGGSGSSGGSSGGGGDSDPVESITRDRGGAGAGGGGEPTVGVGDSTGSGSSSSGGGSDAPAPPEQGLEIGTPDGQSFTPEERALTDAAQGLQEQVTDQIPELGTEDVRVTRDGDTLEAELTRTGEDVLQNDPTAAISSVTRTRADPTRADDNPADPGGTTDAGLPQESITRDRESAGAAETGIDPDDPGDAPGASGQSPSGDAGASLTLTQVTDPTPSVEGGDQRLFNQAAEQRRDQEQFGDIAVENPITNNRIEEDLEGLSGQFQGGVDDALRTVSARPDRTGVSAVRETAIDTVDPFGLALAGKEGVEFAADAVDRLPARDATNQERIDALTSGELPASDSRESFIDDLEARGSTVATAVGESATESPGEFGLEIATGFLGGTAAASTARRGAQVARSNVGPRLADELDVARALGRDNRGMANFPEQRTITKTKAAESDLDRLADELDEMSLRDRAEQRLPPREEFASDDAFQRELELTEQRLIERELDDLADETQSTTQSVADDLQETQTAATRRGGRGRQREPEATAGRGTDGLFGDVAAGFAGAAGSQPELDVTADRGTDGLLTDTTTGLAGGAGTQLDVEATQVTGQQTAVGASLGLQQGTQLNQGIQTDLADDVSIGITADTTAGQPTDTIGGQQTTTQTGTQTGTQTTTTTTTTATRGSSGSGGTRGRPRPELPDFDNSGGDEEEFDLDSGLGEETVVNPTRTLSEVDDDLQAMFDGGGGRGP